jgi:TonB family protein
MVDMTLIDLDMVSEVSKNSAARIQPPENEEWQNPTRIKRFQSFPPPKPKPQLKPEGAGNGEYRSPAQVSQLPHFQNEVKAVYPEAAKRANIEGVVILQVDIDASGAVKKVDLIQGLGYGCDEAAIAAVGRSTFTPAYAADQPVPVRIRIPYRFKFEY